MLLLLLFNPECLLACNVYNKSNMQLQAAGVRVLLPYLPWDKNTNPAGQDHVAALVDQVNRLPGSKVISSNRYLLLGLTASTVIQ